MRADEVDVTAGGIRFRATTPAGDVEVRSPLTGRFNVHNLLAALAFATSQGIDLGAAAQALAAMPGVAGRMRRVDAGQLFTVVVDYAHTPDSLAKVLDELRAVTAGRLITVFGAAGERDRGKRPHMGRIASERCELVILTDEDGLNPSDLSTYRKLADNLRPDTRDIVMLQDFIATPALRDAMTQPELR